MRKFILFLEIAGIGINVSAFAVPMNAKIKNLLQQKEAKIAALEKCNGQKKGWMIAGISTIGVTAVGVAGNIVLADKSKNLTNEIDSAKNTLESKQAELTKLQSRPSADASKDENSKSENNEMVILSGEAIGTSTVKPKASKVTAPIVTEPVEQDFSENGTGYCYKLANGNFVRGDMILSECDSLDYGEWITWFPNNRSVRGISICAEPGQEYPLYSIPGPEIQDTVQTEYDKWAQNGHPEHNWETIFNCYCRVNGEQNWVFENTISGAGCNSSCAYFCAEATQRAMELRKSLFSK